MGVFTSKKPIGRGHLHQCNYGIPLAGCGRHLVAAWGALCGSQSALRKDKSADDTDKCLLPQDVQKLKKKKK